MNAGRPNGGIREQTEQEGGLEPNWLPYFSVESAADTARKAEQAGGRTVKPIMDISFGRIAVIADPQRAAFAVFEGETDP